MIKIENEIVKIAKFPDGTLLLKENIPAKEEGITITWLFENNEELVTLIFLVKHLRVHGVTDICLNMPYIPNARQDRVKTEKDVFTLKYFADIINDLAFKSVTVLDPHSTVSEALIDRINIVSPKKYIEKAISKIEKGYNQGQMYRIKSKDISNSESQMEKEENSLLMFYPDEGSMKRYSGMFERPYVFGIKKRDWTTGEIKGLDVSGEIERIRGSKILVVDDICSRGGTFYYSAKRLKELGAEEIYLYVTHCENTILEGELLSTGLVEKVFTTNSIFTKENERIEVFDYE